MKYETSIEREPLNHSETVSAAPGFSPLAGESARAFEAFRIYHELGPRRRYAVTARKVGVALSTVKRWAGDFDWRGRIQTFAAQALAQSAKTENTLHRAALLDAVARNQTLRDRQYALAESVLAVAERYVERMDEDYLDQLSLGDACKAFALATRFGQFAPEIDASAAADQNLRDQMATLLDQVYAETVGPKTPSTPNLTDPPKL